MSTPNLASLTWRKSSFSDESNCVELALSAVRDSKNPGPILNLEGADLPGFIAAAKAGAFVMPHSEGE
jgi:hypothetical protein